MADDVTVDGIDQPDFTVSTEELSNGSHLQSVELHSESAGAKTKFGTASNPIKIDPTGSTTQPISHAALTELAAAIDTELQVDVVGALPTGDNNIGNVDVATSPAALRTTDSIAAALAVDRLMNNLTLVTPVMAAVDVATSGDNTLVAAQGASNIILVHQVFLVAAGAVTVRFESGAGGTALTGQIQLVANQGFVLPFSPVGWFKTAADTLLNLELSGAVSVDGVLGYTVVQ